MAVVSEDDDEGLGRTLGIVTIEDFLEELVGDIWDESDEIDESFSKLGGNRYRIDTHMTVGEAFARMNCPPPEPRVAKMPLLAWVIETFRHIPVEEETFTYRDMEITVDTVDGHRVSYVVIQPHGALTHAQAAADIPEEATVTEADLPAPMADEGVLSKEVSV